MKKIAFLLILICCFSCKNEKQDSPVFISDTEIIESIDSIAFHKDFKSLEKFSNEQLFAKYFKENQLDSLYEISNHINPIDFITDFNGDNNDDIVFLVRNKVDNKSSLIFFHSRTDFFIIGGGNENSVIENINYTEFEIDRSRIAYETVIDSISGDIIDPKKIKLKNIALHMKEVEGTSGLLTWNGQKYVYIHTGD